MLTPLLSYWKEYVTHLFVTFDTVFPPATVQCFDNGSPGLSVQKQISIAVIDSNDKPTEILINGGSRVLLPENSPPEAVVGQLTCVDQDKSQKHLYTMHSKDDVFMVMLSALQFP